MLFLRGVIEYLSKPLASVGWQESRFREPQNTEVFEDRRKRFDAPDSEDQGFERCSTLLPLSPGRL